MVRCATPALVWKPAYCAVSSGVVSANEQFISLVCGGIRKPLGRFAFNQDKIAVFNPSPSNHQRALPKKNWWKLVISSIYEPQRSPAGCDGRLLSKMYGRGARDENHWLHTDFARNEWLQQKIFSHEASKSNLSTSCLKFIFFACICMLHPERQTGIFRDVDWHSLAPQKQSGKNGRGRVCTRLPSPGQYA